MATSGSNRQAAPYHFFSEQEIASHRLEGVTLQMRPQDVPRSWEEFCSPSRPYAIALDGYLYCEPRYDPVIPCANFDHHVAVDRLATRTAAGQTLLAIRLGLFNSFRDAQGARAQVYVNDCDEDVSLAWFLLKYGTLAEQVFAPVLNRLVFMVDVLDVTAGAYPFPADLDGLQELAWIYDPYRQFRLSGELDQRDPRAFTAIVDATEERLVRYLSGSGERRALDTRYRVIGGGRQWALVEELGAQARTGMLADGIRAYVAVRRRPDGAYTYTVGRMSGFVPFDVPALLEALNVAEGITGPDRWGGSAFVGGSPRLAGSSMSPEMVARVITTALGE